jgi:hypothetical protein
MSPRRPLGGGIDDSGASLQCDFWAGNKLKKFQNLQVQHPLVDVDGWKMVGSKFQLDRGQMVTLIDGMQEGFSYDST